MVIASRAARVRAMLVVGSLVALSSTRAAAADPAATKLFNQGVKLFERGETAAACQKFSESYDIDPAPGTLFNLASCREKLGDASGAHHAYVELTRRAEQAGKGDRAATFRQKATALEAKLPTIVIAEANRASLTNVTIDDTPVPREKWSAPIPTEAGKHKVVLTTDLDGKTANLTVPATGSVTVEAPAPANAPSGARAVVPPPADSAHSPASTGTPPPPETHDAAEPRTTHSPFSYVVGGAGIVAIAVGAAYGVVAIGQKNDALAACPGHQCASPNDLNRATDDHNASQSSALVSTIAIVTGAVLVAGGATLFIVTAKHSSVGVTPATDGHGYALLLTGRFQ
jgi:hypothetical protein